MSKVQPIDGYVKHLLRNASERYNLDIDADNPTRGQRLEAALAMQDESNGFYSMEIMVGQRVDSSDPGAKMFGMLKLAEAMRQSNSKRFYDGFAHTYWPETKKR